MSPIKREKRELQKRAEAEEAEKKASRSTKMSPLVELEQWSPLDADEYFTAKLHKIITWHRRITEPTLRLAIEAHGSDEDTLMLVLVLVVFALMISGRTVIREALNDYIGGAKESEDEEGYQRESI